MPPPPPNIPLTAPAKAPDTPSRPRFTGITSVEYVSGGPTSPWLSQRESQVGPAVPSGPRRPGKPGAGVIFQYNSSFSCRIIQNVARQDTKNPVGQARGGAFLPHPGLYHTKTC